jgi:hypothetical protein
MTIRLTACFLASLLLLGRGLQAQPLRAASPTDPCGLPDTAAAAFKLAAAANWGYGFDSLRADIARWCQSQFVRLDSIGASVQGRPLYVLTIEDTTAVGEGRKRVWVHARTHPSEVQGTYVVNEMLDGLLDDTPLARVLRKECVFSVLPMYNPDGVELARARENANGIDLESNWDAVPGEAEVQALRAHFTVLMAQDNPILVALNLHSSVSCVRYFVAHAASGTSPAYLELEQRYIGAVRAHFPGGVAPWDFFVSWSGLAPTVYPESWFWYNYREAVLALTYEDMNCTAAGAFDSTAQALLFGIGEFLGVLPVTSIVAAHESNPSAFFLGQNYPNPFNPTTTIAYILPEACYTVLTVHDLLGQEVARPVAAWQEAGVHRVTLDASHLATGAYLYRLVAGEYRSARRLLLLR